MHENVMQWIRTNTDIYKYFIKNTLCYDTSFVSYDTSAPFSR